MPSQRESDAPLLQAFDAIARADATTLILGSMPGVESLQKSAYYAHPRNAFWPIVQAIFGGSIDDYAKRQALLLSNKLALWDVLKTCQRPGSLDASIDPASVVCNDFGQFFSQHPQLTKILFNGRTAEKLFRRRVLPSLAQPDRFTMVCLPSTSPAMASLSLDAKIAHWRGPLSEPVDPLCADKT